MKNNIKKILENKTDKLINITLIGCFLIILLKTIISTYASSVITLLPSLIIFIWFTIRFFKKKIKIKSYDIFFALMLLTGTISGFTHNQNFIAIAYQIKALAIYYMLFMIIRNINIKENAIKKILKYINIITIIIVLLSFVEIIFHKNILFPSEWAKDIVYLDNYIRAYSLICNPNVYAFFLMLIMLYNYRFNKPNFSLKNIIFYSLILSGIIISISRSALIFLAFMAVLFILKIFFERKNKAMMKSSIKLLILSVVITAIFSQSIYKLNDIYLEKKDNKTIIEKEPSKTEQNNTDKKPQDNNNKKPNKENVTNEKDTNKNDKTPTTNKEENNINQEKTEENKEDFFTRIIAMFDSQFLTDSLNNGRLAVIRYGFTILENNLLIGTGFSSFLTASSFLNPNLEAKALGLEYADNQYIAILVETGIIGFAFLAMTVLLMLYEQIKNKKYVSIIATLLIAYFGLFINSLEVQLIAFLYFLLIAIDKKEIE